MTNDQYMHQKRFTDPENVAAWQNLYGSAQRNYADASKLYNQALADYNSGKSYGNDSWFKQGWEQWNGLDTNNLQKLNSGSYNPNDNADWVSANNDIDANARRGWGKTLNQVNQNIIASGMANGSGHQTAAYQTAAGLNSQLAADRANRWQQQYNQNIANMMNANQQLNNIYQGRTNAGLQGWQTSQQGYAQGFNNALQAQNARDQATRVLGQAVEMNADPSVQTRQHQYGTSTTDATNTQKSSGGFGDIIGSVSGMFAPIKWFG